MCQRWVVDYPKCGHRWEEQPYQSCDNNDCPGFDRAVEVPDINCPFCENGGNKIDGGQYTDSPLPPEPERQRIRISREPELEPGCTYPRHRITIKQRPYEYDDPRSYNRDGSSDNNGTTVGYPDTTRERPQDIPNSRALEVNGTSQRQTKGDNYRESSSRQPRRENALNTRENAYENPRDQNRQASNSQPRYSRNDQNRETERSRYRRDANVEFHQRERAERRYRDNPQGSNLRADVRPATSFSQDPKHTQSTQNSPQNSINPQPPHDNNPESGDSQPLHPENQEIASSRHSTNEEEHISLPENLPEGDHGSFQSQYPSNHQETNPSRTLSQDQQDESTSTPRHEIPYSDRGESIKASHLETPHSSRQQSTNSYHREIPHNSRYESISSTRLGTSHGERQESITSRREKTPRSQYRGGSSSVQTLPYSNSQNRYLRPSRQESNRSRPLTVDNRSEFAPSTHLKVPPYERRQINNSPQPRSRPHGSFQGNSNNSTHSRNCSGTETANREKSLTEEKIRQAVLRRNLALLRLRILMVPLMALGKQPPKEYSQYQK
ncbi:hypothetical protein TWF694_011441 [Orbilia ellipsospora]|uniref:Uncharacterized protein n=1 Tax=Orbilia ellipsospora TaxID=2528407 RepID=A0AAV9X578_9PEZI